MKLTLSTGEAHLYVRFGEDDKKRRTTTVRLVCLSQFQEEADLVATVACSHKDKFCRAIGRKLALRNIFDMYDVLEKSDRFLVWQVIYPKSRRKLCY